MLIKMDIDFGGVNFPLPYRKPGKVYVGFVAVFSGCRRAINGDPCPGCQNPSLWDYLEWSGDTHAWIEDFVRKKYVTLKKINSEIEFFYCILGGEPLDQDIEELECVHHRVMTGCGREISTVLFTGYDEVPERTAGYMADSVDYLKTGAYLGDKYKESDLLSGLATKNQKWTRNTRPSRVLFS